MPSALRAPVSRGSAPGLGRLKALLQPRRSSLDTAMSHEDAMLARIASWPDTRAMCAGTGHSLPALLRLPEAPQR